ncbi:MAG: DUF3352 domain-containing protein [Anaerolineae bacterium]|nr:DUF3352 domain-containing protein [Anaerolineae bacterium]
MKKLFALLAIMVVAMGTLFAPTMAAPTADLNKLAEYFPATAPILVSFRTDDAYIKETDDLIAKVAAQIPGMTQPDTIASQFDKAIKEVIGSGDFNSEVRSWLGDEVSIGIYSFEGMMGRGESDGKPPHFLAAIAITNQKAAEAFWKTALAKSPSGNYQTSTEGDFTVYTPGASSSASGIVAIGKDVIFVAGYKEDVPFKGQDKPLSDSPTFADNIKLLPEADYNITIYTNFGDVFQQLIAAQANSSNTAMATQAEMMKSLAPLMKNFPPEILGFTVLDERSLTVDIVVPYGNLMKDFEAAGFSMAMPDPVDPAFAANILSGSPVVFHSTNLGATLAAALKNFQIEAGMMSSTTGMSSTEMQDTLNKITFAIQGLTGKDLQKDILPAMKGNYALYLALSPALSDVSTEADLTKQLPVDFGFLTEMSDPSISKAIMDAAKTALAKSKDVKITTEKIGGADAVVITGTSAGMPFPVELVLTGNDKLFFFGTRRAAQAALTGSGGLDKDASFKEAAGYLVPSPTVIAYLASEGLKPLTKVIGLGGNERDSQQFATFLKLLSSASISSTTKDNAGYARLVWTLPQ